MERLKRQEEKRKSQRRQKILEAADPSPSKGAKRTLSEAVSEARGFGADALQQDLERIRGLEDKDRALKAGRDGPGDRLSSDEFQEAKSFFAATKEFSDNATRATKSVIDTILVADFFFIILVLLWLIAGVVERQALDSTKLLDVWLPLWGTVFQPAIGVLMAGTIVSGTISTLSQNPDE
ncbi:hypothetical protein KFL_004650120 [Klebsormidium nitens]|uniref:Uncharacterized protein n=1 Tax=Klebsormidium nitens TaxID=105231 RepID=A0A1Y1IJR1_KLENI|nr:hypothetical protein KFL_004650120 [Klebsormidium nitens]|eukprot:GAQ88867.1 hypothetical protein KFL_004650120 [Klebsormidium nitens]